MQNIEHVISELPHLRRGVSTLRADILAYAENGTVPSAERVIERAWCYPELRIHYAGRDASRRQPRLWSPALYGHLFDHGDAPALYAHYLTEQLGCWPPITPSRSRWAAPRSRSPSLCAGRLRAGQHRARRTGPAFPATELALIGDELADGIDLGRVDDDPPGPVRRSAHRFLAGASGALHRHRHGSLPALYPVHQLSPLCR
jgi:AMP nucleosidase